jgi:hypothetical protein
METAWMQIVQMGPCRALDRTDRVVVSSSRTVGHRRSRSYFEVAQDGLVVVGVVDDAAAAELVFVVGGGATWGEGSVRDMDQVQIRLVLDRRPYQFGHRTPVLYSRNQPRTNIARKKENDNRDGTACRVAHNDFEN